MVTNSRRIVGWIGRHGWKALAVVGVVAVAAVGGTSRTEAHKAITSPYTYNEHIFPILKERCGGCHFEGGPTPMSLMTYLDASPWAESMREQLVGERMPPWYADPLGPSVKGGYSLPTRELDTLITWAIGGTPRGSAGTDPPAYTPPEPAWELGPPDLEVPMTEEHVVKAGSMEEDQAFTLATNLERDTWVEAVDLLPGSRSMLRDAVVSLENGPVLATWVPGNQPAAAPRGAAFKLPAGARLVVKMHYKKNWMDVQNDIADRSTIGLYFPDEPPTGRPIESVTLEGPVSENDSADPITFGNTTLETGARVVALRPSFDRPYASAEFDAVLPDGRRTSLLSLHAPQPQWYRTYWLQEPIDLPKGATIEATATPTPPDEFAMPAEKRYPLQVGVDYVPE